MADSTPQKVITHHQMLVVLAVLRGLSNEEISRELAISTHTVKTHLRRTFKRVGVGTREGLAALIVKHHLSSQQLEELACQAVFARALEMLPGCSPSHLVLLNKLADNPEAMSERAGNTDHRVKTMVRAVAGRLGCRGVKKPRTFVVTACLLARWLAGEGRKVPSVVGISTLQRKVLVLVAGGKTDAAIAQELGIEEKDVRAHLTEVALRTDLSNVRTILALFTVNTLLSPWQRLEWRKASGPNNFRRVMRRLTPSQLRVLDMLVVVPGISNGQIATRLNMSQAAVTTTLAQCSEACGLAHHPHARLILTVCRYLMRWN